MIHLRRQSISKAIIVFSYSLLLFSAIAQGALPLSNTLDAQRVRYSVAPEHYSTLSLEEVRDLSPDIFRYSNGRHISAITDKALAGMTLEQAEALSNFELSSPNGMTIFNFEISSPYGFDHCCTGFKDRMNLLDEKVREIVAKKCIPFLELHLIVSKYTQILKSVEYGTDIDASHQKQNRIYFIRVTEEVAVPFIQDFLNIDTNGIISDKSNIYQMFMWEFFKSLAVFRNEIAMVCRHGYVCFLNRLGNNITDFPRFAPVWQNFLMQKLFHSDKYLLEKDYSEKDLSRYPFKLSKEDYEEMSEKVHNYLPASGLNVLLNRNIPVLQIFHLPQTIDELDSIIGAFKAAAASKNPSEKYEKALEFYYLFNGRSLMTRGQGTVSGWILLAFLRSIGKNFDLYEKPNDKETSLYADKMTFNFYALSAENMNEFHEFIRKYNLIYDL